MNPRLPVSGASGLPQWSFMRLWAVTTATPLRGDVPVVDHNGSPTAALQSAWLAAFGEVLRDEPITRNGMPTQYLLNAWREATNEV